MISVAFVNNSYEPVYSASLESALLKECNDIYESILTDINEYYETVENNEFVGSLFGEAGEEDSEGGSNIFARIGNAIIALARKFVSMIDGFINNIKNSSFSKKSETDKIEIAIKKHPELKEVIIANAKDFDFSEIRTLSELDDYCNQILKASSPSKKRELFNKMKTAAAATVTVAAGATTILKLGETVSRMKHKNTEVIDNLENKKMNINKEIGQRKKEIARVQESLRYKDANGKIRTRKLYGANKEYVDQLNTDVQALNYNLSKTNEAITRYHQKSENIFKRAMNAVKNKQ